jgi:arginase
MEYRCLGVNGFAGDRTPEAMLECHPFAQALSEFLGTSVELYGSIKEAKDLQWKEALIESADIFATIAKVTKESISDNCIPILVTPRCASAIASLPVIVSKYPDVIVIYFDAHGDLNVPATSSSGYLGGMPITAAMGCWESGYGSGLDAKNLVHIGGRDLDESEKDFIRDNKIMSLSKEQIESGVDELGGVYSG